MHELLARSEFVVTGQSTSAFEALALGCKVICLAPQYEPILNPLFAGTPTRVVSSASEVAAVMDGFNAAAIRCISL